MSQVSGGFEHQHGDTGLETGESVKGHQPWQVWALRKRLQARAARKLLKLMLKEIQLALFVPSPDTFARHQGAGTSSGLPHVTLTRARAILTWLGIGGLCNCRIAYQRESWPAPCKPQSQYVRVKCQSTIYVMYLAKVLHHANGVSNTAQPRPWVFIGVR